MPRYWLKIVFYLLLIVSHDVVGGEVYACSGDVDRTVVRHATLTGVAGVTAWGVANWGYFSRSPRSQSEGWFGSATQSGGADKLGHLYTTYLLSHGLAEYFQRRCLPDNEAARYGALSALAIMGYMEVGDSFSKYGLSWEDMLANVLGAGAGYLLRRDKALADKFDLRWEYGLHPTKWDISTDYENSRYLLALKLAGFKSLRNSAWRFIEFQTGYYTRGFDSTSTAAARRSVYLGIGLNLGQWFKERGARKTALALRYLQVPGSAARFERHLSP